MAGENAVAAFPAPVAAPVVPATKWKLAKQEIEFNPKSHKYRMDGPAGLRILPSVTTVKDDVLAKPALLWWAAGEAAGYMARSLKPGVPYSADEIRAMADAAQKNYNKESKKAMNYGSIAHKWIERDIYGIPQDLPAEAPARNSVQSWRAWVNENGVEFVESEKVVGNYLLGFAGTVDFFARIRGRDGVFLGDIKTSKAIYKDMTIQVRAYRGLVEPLILEGSISGELIVRIPKEGGDAEVYEVPGDWKKDYTAFLHLLEVYRWQNDEGTWEKAL